MVNRRLPLRGAARGVRGNRGSAATCPRCLRSGAPRREEPGAGASDGAPRKKLCVSLPSVARRCLCRPGRGDPPAVSAGLRRGGRGRRRWLSRRKKQMRSATRTAEPAVTGGEEKAVVVFDTSFSLLFLLLLLLSA